MNEIVKDYLWTFDINNINNEVLYNTCCHVEDFLRSKYPEPVKNDYGCFTSYYHAEYNLFLFACPELHKLYNEICIQALSVIDKSKLYYMRCWSNLFRFGTNIDWHAHFESESKSYHGFYCVNTEGSISSYTDYRIPGIPEIRVPSKNGLMVLGKSDGDKHRSSPWKNQDKFRVTIAFDIIPGEFLRPLNKFNDNYYHTNYVPIFKELK